MATPSLAHGSTKIENTPAETQSPLAGLGEAMRLAEAADRLTPLAPAFAPPPVAPRSALKAPACPRCGSHDLRFSKNPSLGVRMLAMIGLYRRRCRQCGKRSWWL